MIDAPREWLSVSHVDRSEWLVDLVEEVEAAEAVIKAGKGRWRDE